MEPTVPLTEGYRIYLIQLTLWTTAATVAAQALAQLVVGPPPGGPRWFDGLEAGLVAGLAGGAALKLAWRVEIDPHLLTMFSSLRGRRSLRWRHLASVREAGLPGLGFWIFRDIEGRSLWVPQFLEREREFRVLAAALAGDDSAVAAVLHPAR